MTLRSQDKILHEWTKHTNLLIPYSDFVSYNKFPVQNDLLLNSTVEIKYRNMYIVDGDNLEDKVFTAKCKVVRADLVVPYIMICISLDYQQIFVTDTRNYESFIARYPIQLDDFIGIELEDQYIGSLDRIHGITLRVDNGEPCYSVILETFEDSYRFVLGDECQSIMKNYEENVPPKSTNDTLELRKRILSFIMEDTNENN